ncbi:MAG TPA: hypothetical protein VEQ66_16620 [Propionibacteriaceae bacterium]|nr:hypothetical protein [Propionibacteriaceae bacterium]
MSRELARQQLMAWRENWSVADRDLIEQALNQLDEADYYEPNSRQYAAARVGGRVALYIAPGYLYWTSSKWAEGLATQMIPGGLGGGEQDKGRWYALSTFQERGSSQPGFEELRAPCPVCFLVPSVSGACSCD